MSKAATRRELADLKRLEQATALRPLLDCLECGRRFFILGRHLMRMHGLTGAAYLLKHQLPLGTRLETPALVPGRRAHGMRMLALGKFRPGDPSRLPGIREAGQAVLRARPRSEAQREVMKRIVEYGRIAHEAQRQANIRVGRRVIRRCLQCGREYSYRASARHFFCSQACYSEAKKLRPLSPNFRRRGLEAQKLRHNEAVKAHTKTCPGCGRIFSSPRLYCSQACYVDKVMRPSLIRRNRAGARPVECVCCKCGRRFIGKPSSARRYCSRACVSKLTEQERAALRSEYPTLKQYQLAAKYGISQSMVSLIVSRSVANSDALV